MAPVKRTVYQCLQFAISLCLFVKRYESMLLLNSKECIIAGPLGSDIFLVKNFKKPKEPHQVQYEQKKQSLRCQASTCPRYKSFSVCSHTLAIAFKLSIFASYIKKAERRNSNHALTNAFNFGKQKDAGKKKYQSTSKRKGPANSKNEKVMKLVDRDNENRSFSNNNVGLVISDIATPKSSYPNLLPNRYVLGILKFCHKQVSVYYGFGCKFYLDGYPEPSSDLVIVSSMRRSYIDSNHQRVVSPRFSKVYYHFNYNCITVHNHFFAPPLIIIPEDLKLYLSPVHKEVLIASQIQI